MPDARRQLPVTNRRSFVRAALAAAVCFAACSRPDPRPSTRAELRSWIVAGRGRHLYLELFLPDGPVRVEFGSTAQRTDYRPPPNPARAGRISRMTPGVTLRPILSEPDHRLEAEYWLTAAQVRALTRDRVFSGAYVLIGRNSNSAMARAMREAGLALPDRVARGGGLLGEFPGIDLDPGDDVPVSRWREYGLAAPDVPRG